MCLVKAILGLIGGIIGLVLALVAAPVLILLALIF